ncbi:unnamed protein product [Meganyctiphanes norvegica]|uniref:U1-type domain-containing protein n=1 Tax=Meganyctiphanes norvegica TaxID=48144 RepID=A0AAV2QVW0_MEGNR
MSTADEYVSPLMASKRDKPTSQGTEFKLPSQMPSKPQVRTFHAAFKIDPDWPKELVEKFSNNQCILCNVKMTSEPMARAHYNGKPHLKGIKKFLIDHGSSLQEAEAIDMNNSTARKAFENQVNRPATSVGESAVFKIEPNWPKQLVQKFSTRRCSLCDVEMTSNVIAKAHYDGKPHQKKINKFLLGYDPTAEEAKTNESSFSITPVTPVSEDQMNIFTPTTVKPASETKHLIRPDTSVSRVPKGPELNPYNFTLVCSDMPKMHIHSDGAIDGKANSKASSDDIVKMSTSLIKCILKNCLKASRNKEKEKKQAKKRKADGKELENVNAVGRIEGRHCRIAFMSYMLDKMVWLGRKKTKSMGEKLGDTGLQHEAAISENLISEAEYGRGDIHVLGRNLTSYFDIHIWQDIEEPDRILVTGVASGSEGVQLQVFKPMYSFFASMAQSQLKKAATYINTKTKK